MRWELDIDDRAHQLLEEQAVFLAKDDLRTADRFLRAFTEIQESIKEFPYSGYAYDSFSLLFVKPMRRPFQRYLVFYEVRPDEHVIVILLVRHGSRAPF